MGGGGGGGDTRNTLIQWCVTALLWVKFNSTSNHTMLILILQYSWTHLWLNRSCCIQYGYYPHIILCHLIYKQEENVMYKHDNVFMCEEKLKLQLGNVASVLVPSVSDI